LQLSPYAHLGEEPQKTHFMRHLDTLLGHIRSQKPLDFNKFMQEHHWHHAKVVLFIEGYH